MISLRITREARDDLRDIRVFSKASFGAAAAKAYMASLEGRFALLLERPAAGSMQADLAPGVRAFPSGSHRIYYRVTDTDVVILRVLHHARSKARHGLA